MLPLDDFKAVVRNTPLVAVDLVVRNTQGKVLIGCRKNSPAQGYWFVPGGRVFKNEPSEEALHRISKDELGFQLEAGDLRFLGVFDHIYPDNFFRDGTFNTHYIVLASEVVITHDLKLPDEQHGAYRFETVQNLLRDALVHPFTKSYFESAPSNRWKFRYEGNTTR